MKTDNPWHVLEVIGEVRPSPRVTYVVSIVEHMFNRGRYVDIALAFDGEAITTRIRVAPRCAPQLCGALQRAAARVKEIE